MQKLYYNYIFLDPRKPRFYGALHGVLIDHEPIYVGKGTKNRIWDHVFNIDSHYNKAFSSKLKKIYSLGLTPIVVIINETPDEESCYKLEEKFIRLFGRLDKGTGSLCNLTSGGDGVRNRIVSDEERQKISKRGKGRKASEQAKQNMSKGRMGLSYGPLADEHKDKISKGLLSSEKKKLANLAAKGRYRESPSAEVRKKISDALTGHCPSDETRELWSKQRRGVPLKETNKNYQLWDIDGVEMNTRAALDILKISQGQLRRRYKSRFPNR